MGPRGSLRRCPISSQQRAAMRAAQEHVDRVVTQGSSAEEQAQARAAIDAMSQPRQPPLPLKLQLQP